MREDLLELADRILGKFKKQEERIVRVYAQVVKMGRLFELLRRILQDEKLDDGEAIHLVWRAYKEAMKRDAELQQLEKEMEEYFRSLEYIA